MKNPLNVKNYLKKIYISQYNGIWGMQILMNNLNEFISLGFLFLQFINILWQTL
jgi:hypothetical protein